MNALRSLVCCFFVAALLVAAPINAQEIPLTEFYEPFNGNLTIYYPAGWSRMFSHGELIVSNDPSALTWYTTIPLNAGEVVIILQDPVRVTEEVGSMVAAVADALAAETPMTEQSPLSVHGQAAVRLVESDERLHVVFNPNEEQLTYATLITVAGERSDFEAVFLAILEQVAVVEPEPEPEPASVGIDHQLRSPLQTHYDGSVSIPFTFDYPNDWFIDEYLYEKTVYISNAEFGEEDLGASDIIVSLQVFPQPIADVPHFRDLILTRYWQRSMYFTEPALFGQAGLTGVYGVLSGREAREFDLGFYLNADLVFADGLVFIEAYGGWAREYEEDDSLIFDIIKSVQILD